MTCGQQKCVEILYVRERRRFKLNYNYFKKMLLKTLENEDDYIEVSHNETMHFLSLNINNTSDSTKH